jgi:hypothetical protein
MSTDFNKKNREYEISQKPVVQKQKMSTDFNKKNPEYEISLKPVGRESLCATRIGQATQA